MAVLLNEVIINADGTFNFIPEWEENPITNMPGCAPEFIGAYVYFELGTASPTITSFDTSTGQVIGSVDLGTLVGDSLLFGYGFEDCSTIPSSPSVNVLPNFSQPCELFSFFTCFLSLFLILVYFLSRALKQ